MTHPYTPKPANLAELYFYEILNTEKEKQFNDIVELASLICECPISTITFIDKDRQWYKARKSMPVSETHLNISICAYTSWHGETLIVEDALMDDRFSHFSNVTGGVKIRFYAGAPIRTLAGIAIGSLCVIDTKPKKINAQQVQALEKLATQVSYLLELRLLNKHLERTTNDLLNSIETHTEFFDNAPLPQWIISLTENKFLAVNKAAETFYGFTKEEFSQMFLLDVLESDAAGVKEVHNNLMSIEKLNLIVTHKMKNGEKKYVDVTLNKIAYKGNNAIICSMVDLSEKLYLKDQIDEEKRSSVEKMENTTLVAQRQEREYLGRELHDNINQMLASIKLHLDLAYSNTEIRLKMIEQSKEYLIYTMDEVRKLSHKLVNEKSSGLDLNEAIQEVLQPYFLIDTFKTTYVVEDNLNSLPVDIKITILRIIQESIQNIDKYAQATKVWIELKTKEKVHLLIRDNGIGFDVNTITHGIGIKNMQERVSKLNGQIRLFSSKGEGCTIQVIIPLLKNFKDKEPNLLN